MPDEDVTQADSSPAEGTVENADTSPVSAETPGTRTVDNVYGEFNRKFGKLQSQLETLMQYVAAQQRPTASPAQGQEPVTKEQLWALAQQGDRIAFEEYQRRIAAEQYQQQSQVDRRTQLIASQLNALVAKYPVLRDASHPLTQAAHQAHAILLQNGYANDQATLLEAAKTAIADRPDLVSEIFSQPGQAREQMRQTTTSRAQTGVTGVSHRAQDAPQAKAPRLTPEQAELARRMGVKDPKGAKERFLKRQESGQSSLGGVAAFVNESEF